MNSKATFLLCVAFLFACSVAAHGCICREKPGVEQAAKESEAVFSGKVALKLKDGVRFKVKQSWKGVSARYMYIYTGNIRNDCDLSFRVGELWLIYAVKVPLFRTENGTASSAVKLVASACSRSARLEDAVYDLRKLGEPVRRERRRKIARGNSVTGPSTAIATSRRFSAIATLGQRS